MTKTGFILMELLLAMLILEIGILGVAGMFLDSIQAYSDTKKALQALELLRGEMEKTKKAMFYSVKTQSAKVLAGEFLFYINVQNITFPGEYLPEKKIITCKITWQNTVGKTCSYNLVTSRWYTD